MKKAIKAAKGIFKIPKKFLYLGKIRYYTPYFLPRGFLPDVIRVRKLTPLSEERLEENKKRGYGWLKEKWANMPMVQRCWGREVRLLGNTYYLQVGWPFAYVRNEGSWKDKFNSPRLEWTPFKQFWFFKWQLHVGYKTTGNDDQLYEQILWWYYYCDKDIKKAEETWPWQDVETRKSTWNKNLLK